MTSVPTTIVDTSQSIDTSYSAYLVDASQNNVTLTLMDISESEGDAIHIKRIDGSANTVIIQGYDSSQTIDGQTSVQFAFNQAFRIVAINAVWYSITDTR